ncbi:MAG: CBS domain-containing protein [Candidatus Hadarchaeum sp.]|uniref:CBS domain-containing protein n=1 Tax=Candidatus Hadarchaeum sp. TaxID=2883567 RepID=UPI00316C1FE9
MKRVIPVSEAMRTEVLTVPRGTNVARAAKLMASKDVGSIVVVDGKKPVGILTEKDLLMKVVSEDLKPSKIRVGKIMSAPLITIGPDVDIVEAAKIMASHKIRRIPVVKNGKLVGIVTSSDITAISPALSELMAHPERVPEERVDQSVCENCGEVTPDLYEVNGMWVCENCRDSMGE